LDASIDNEDIERLFRKVSAYDKNRRSRESAFGGAKEEGSVMSMFDGKVTPDAEELKDHFKINENDLGTQLPVKL
jgi:hypothetical protein